MTRPGPRSRSGFTVIEMLLALSLASIVMAGVFSMMALMYRTTSRLEGTATRTVDLAGAQTVIRRAMNTLVAGVPLLDDPLAEGEESDDAFLDEEGDEPSIEELINSVVNDPAVTAEILSASIPAEVHFELYYDEAPSGEIQPVLSIVTTESPVARTPNILASSEQVFMDQVALLDEQAFVAERARQATSGPVRGVFELARDATGSLVLQFAWPDEPMLRPFVLVHDIEVARWEALIKEDPDDEFSPKIWTDIHAAYLASDFPYAVRLMFRTTEGQYVDWIFEVAVIEPEPQS